MHRLHSRTILFVSERNQSIITRLEQCRIYAYDIKIWFINLRPWMESARCFPIRRIRRCRTWETRWDFPKWLVAADLRLLQHRPAAVVRLRHFRPAVAIRKRKASVLLVQYLSSYKEEEASVLNLDDARRRQWGLRLSIDVIWDEGFIKHTFNFSLHILIERSQQQTKK